MLRIRKINIITVAVCNPFSVMGSVQVGSQGNGLSAKRPPKSPEKYAIVIISLHLLFTRSQRYRKIKGVGVALPVLSLPPVQSPHAQRINLLVKQPNEQGGPLEGSFFHFLFLYFEIHLTNISTSLKAFQSIN